jgi:hypothetical protein
VWLELDECVCAATPSETSRAAANNSSRGAVVWLLLYYVRVRSPPYIGVLVC